MRGGGERWRERRRGEDSLQREKREDKRGESIENKEPGVDNPRTRQRERKKNKGTRTKVRGCWRTGSTESKGASGHRFQTRFVASKVPGCGKPNVSRGAPPRINNASIRAPSFATIRLRWRRTGPRLSPRRGRNPDARRGEYDGGARRVTGRAERREKRWRAGGGAGQATPPPSTGGSAGPGTRGVGGVGK